MKRKYLKIRFFGIDPELKADLKQNKIANINDITKAKSCFNEWFNDQTKKEKLPKYNEIKLEDANFIEIKILELWTENKIKDDQSIINIIEKCTKILETLKKYTKNQKGKRHEKNKQKNSK